jgi:hypothetical protein
VPASPDKTHPRKETPCFLRPCASSDLPDAALNTFFHLTPPGRLRLLEIQGYRL